MFAYMVEDFIEVFMDDILIVEYRYEEFLTHFVRVLKICVDTNLALNWEKYHFMENEGIVLGHKVSQQGFEVDKE